jgi:hypothetical protein
MYKHEHISRRIVNEVETSHYLISIRLYFILTILITDDGPQTSFFDDCLFNWAVRIIVFTTNIKMKMNNHTVEQFQHSIEKNGNR